MKFIFALIFICIFGHEDEQINDCETDKIMLNGPKELTIAILVSLAVGVGIGLAIKPLISYTHKKVTQTDAWEP